MALSSEEIEALLAEPALEAPSGITPNFDNPPNQNDLAWFVTTFCTVIMTIAFFLRLYAKWWMSRKVHVEEVLMVLAYGAYWGTAYAGYALIYTPGYYVHQWNLYNRDLIRPLYLILVYGCSYSAVLPLLKTAILLDWCRIFVPGDRLKSPFWWGLPCIPAILKEHGISPKIRKALGLSSKSSPNITEPDSKAYGSSKPHPSHGLSKSGLTSVGTYYQIDEEDGGAMPLGALKTSESQEQLHTHQAKNTMQVTRTTHIAVTSDSHSAQSGSDIGDNGTPWTK
ncbi:hypothetical protein UCRPC4_g02266 [Phaeomoniella chlamydospora]|uniref:Rhodopsin domain-containing protein n=1 Tax=Phaeomoniella chlamydospora TaxID=158046 RepID=A0A0G2H8G9_PHACM|nr:hypothetical protein UCRPC4_g02266 [Phaeomoniella chlamydospora]